MLTCGAFRAVRVVAPESRAGSLTCRVRWQHVELRPRQLCGTLCSRWPSRTRSAATRACTGPPSSTFLASSRRRQMWNMVLRNLLLSAGSPELSMCARPWVVVCGSALLQVPVPRHHHSHQVERRSGTGRRSRRSGSGGSDISLPLAPREHWFVWLDAGTRVQGRTTGSGAPCDTQACVLSGPTGLNVVLGVCS